MEDVSGQRERTLRSFVYRTAVIVTVVESVIQSVIIIIPRVTATIL